jgi:rhodanese-related sulfurtransferase
MEGHLDGISSIEFRDWLTRKQSSQNRHGQGKEFLFLDVREPAEVKAASIKGHTNIPLGTLRDAEPKIPKDKPVVCFCHLGMRGYEASLILRAAGHDDVRVVEGGLAMWPFEVERG